MEQFEWKETSSKNSLVFKESQLVAQKVLQRMALFCPSHHRTNLGPQICGPDILSGCPLVMHRLILSKFTETRI